MKKLIVFTALAILLTGCSRLEPYLEKIPYVKDRISSSGDNKMDEEKEQPAGNEQEGTEPNQEDPENEGENSGIGEQLSLEAAYFNDIKQVNGKNVIHNPNNPLVLVNKTNSLPDGYTPADLIRPAVPFPFGEEKLEKSYLRAEAAHALEKMFAEAKKNGIELYAVSGYRSYERQTVLFEAEIKRVGKEKAVQAVAVPGSSEHQTGLAIDISSKSVDLGLTEDFGTVKEGIWLKNNAHRFGFIIRYPKGKESITQYQYEPWHFRYVGEKAAAEIQGKNLTLEEYFTIVKKI